ncbi:hypothetical protein DsansV1_C14g0129381 [Dioscorea sansibarensis]
MGKSYTKRGLTCFRGLSFLLHAFYNFQCELSLNPHLLDLGVYYFSNKALRRGGRVFLFLWFIGAFIYMKCNYAYRPRMVQLIDRSLSYDPI